MPKAIQKATKIGAKNDPRSNFGDFWAFWAERKFRRFFGTEKSGPKIKKTQLWMPKAKFRKRSAAEAVPGEALESEDF